MITIDPLLNTVFAEGVSAFGDGGICHFNKANRASELIQDLIYSYFDRV